MEDAGKIIHSYLLFYFYQLSSALTMWIINSDRLR